MALWHGPGLVDATVSGPAHGASVFRSPGAEVAGSAGFFASPGGERTGRADRGGWGGDARGIHRRVVAAAVFPAPPRRWLVTGGGRHNPAIMAALRSALGVPVEPVETVGWDGDALEAQCFGFLAARVARGLPLSFRGTTGVPVPMPGGRIVTG